MHRLVPLLVVVWAITASDPPAAPPLMDAVGRARDRVFPTLVHLQPVFDASRNGRKIETQSTGSGVIVRADGLVVTNFHVAGTAKRLVCTLADRRRCTADLVGGDAATDLALVRLRLDELGETTLPAAELAPAAALAAGDFVLAMGSPLGLTRSLSLGVVSCPDRYLEPMVVNGHVPTGLFNTWIQTDAAINPGNSGGPLVDLAGRVVGINSRGYRGADNLGFAIPAGVVREVLDALLADGRVARSRIGIACQPMKELAGRFGGPGDGLLVASVEPGSSAERAGLRAGDVVTAYDGMSLPAVFDEDVPAARRRMAAVPAGKEIEVAVWRGSAHCTFSVLTEEWRPPENQDHEVESLGLTLRGLSDRERRERFLEDGAGILVTGVRPGGRAARASPPFEREDVLLAVDGAAVRTPAEAEQALEQVARPGSGWRLVTVRRGQGDYLVALRGDGVGSPVAGDRR